MSLINSKNPNLIPFLLNKIGTGAVPAMWFRWLISLDRPEGTVPNLFLSFLGFPFYEISVTVLRIRDILIRMRMRILGSMKIFVLIFYFATNIPVCFTLFEKRDGSWSRSGTILVTNRSGCGSGRPKNGRIRIWNTAILFFFNNTLLRERSRTIQYIYSFWSHASVSTK